MPGATEVLGCPGQSKSPKFLFFPKKIYVFRQIFQFLPKFLTIFFLVVCRNFFFFFLQNWVVECPSQAGFPGPSHRPHPLCTPLVLCLQKCLCIHTCIS